MSPTYPETPQPSGRSFLVHCGAGPQQTKGSAPPAGESPPGARPEPQRAPARLFPTVAFAALVPQPRVRRSASQISDPIRGGGAAMSRARAKSTKPRVQPSEPRGAGLGSELRQRVRRTAATDCRDSRTPFSDTGAQCRAAPVSVPQPPDCPAFEHQPFPADGRRRRVASRSGVVD